LPFGGSGASEQSDQPSKASLKALNECVNEITRKRHGDKGIYEGN